jgi:hypothetical protein
LGTGDPVSEAAVDVRTLPAVADLIGEGAAIVVATRDADLRPRLGRGWGASLSGTSRLRLCVDAPERSPLRAALADRREIAVTFAQPSTYRSLQVKGTVSAVGEPTAEQLALVDGHEAAFSADAENIGVAPRMIARMLDRASLIAVTLAIEEVYDQTPGAAAGDRL